MEYGLKDRLGGYGLYLKRKFANIATLFVKTRDVSGVEFGIVPSSAEQSMKISVIREYIDLLEAENKARWVEVYGL